MLVLCACATLIVRDVVLILGSDGALSRCAENCFSGVNSDGLDRRIEFEIHTNV